jgi:hypothetical protein
MYATLTRLGFSPARVEAVLAEIPADEDEASVMKKSLVRLRA